MPPIMAAPATTWSQSMASSVSSFASLASPSTSRKPGSSSWPRRTGPYLLKLSTPTTSCPACSGSATRYPQMKPADPVTRTFKAAASGRRSHIARGEGGANVRNARRTFSESDRSRHAPDVDHLAVFEVEVLVGVVRGGDDEQLGFLQHAVQRHERLVMDVRVGTKDACTLESGQLSQLVAERGPGVVRLAFESHAENAHRTARKGAPRVEGVDDVVRQALVDLHRRLAHRKVVGRER